MVSESYDDGWTAAIDGQPVEIERVNGDFLGCVVPVGEHDVTIEFRPAHLKWGKSISLFGVFVAAVLAASSARRPA